MKSAFMKWVENSVDGKGFKFYINLYGRIAAGVEIDENFFINGSLADVRAAAENMGEKTGAFATVHRVDDGRLVPSYCTEDGDCPFCPLADDTTDCKQNPIIRGNG